MMRLLLDTHILVWIVLNDRRLSTRQRAALSDPDNSLILNPLVAYELSQLQSTGRLALHTSIDRLQELVGFETVDLPFDIWRTVTELPDIHRDPIDRMLIAQAISTGLTIVSADAQIRRYDVACI